MGLVGVLLVCWDAAAITLVETTPDLYVSSRRSFLGLSAWGACSKNEVVRSRSNSHATYSTILDAGSRIEGMTESFGTVNLRVCTLFNDESESLNRRHRKKTDKVY